MAWTTPKTWNVAEKVTAALMNLHLRDNLAYLKGLLDGTGSGDVTIPSGAGFFIGDSNFWAKDIVSGTHFPTISFDTNDFLQYDRSIDRFRFAIGAADKLFLDSGGKLTGAGFYDSGEISLGNNGSQALSHGLSARPRFVGGVYSTTAGQLGDSSTTDVIPLVIGQTGTANGRIVNAKNTTITVQNNGVGVTIYARVFAMV